MAFDFLKKLVGKLVGGSSAKKPAQGQKNGARAGISQRRGKRGGRGRNGAKAREEGNGSGAPDRTRQAVRPEAQRQERDGRRRDAHGRGGAGFGQNRRDGGERRGDRGSRGRAGRGRDSQRPVNTSAGEMRPGGEISAEELARRQAAHEAWNPADFAVEPVEGKKRFHDFDLPGEVMHGIAELGFRYCTEIQAMSLSHALAGRNIAGKALTGSGKTAAFLVAILTRYLRTPGQRAAKGGMPRALVIAPTRELVIQICKDADAIGKYCPLRSLAVYGGMDYDRQRRELLDKPVDLLVATPGRLLDFCQQRVIDLSGVDTLVIDEADRMLDMGFIPDVRRIIGYLPPKDRRATMLYSATLTDEVMRLASQWMEEPVRCEIEGEQVATDTVRQVVYITRAENKFKMLFNHIVMHPEARTIVFCNRKSTTEDVYESLKCRSVKAEMLSGDVNQNKRLKVLEDFRAGAVKIVIATDVAGRGIHVDDIEYVINFDFPYEAEDYVHRIGRTGRAGNTGIAISFADEDESFAIPEIEKYIGEPLKCTMIADDDPLLKELPPRGTAAAAVSAEELAAVDAREAVTEAEKAAAAAVTGVKALTGNGREMILPDNAVQRKLPTFENALDPKAPPPDESDAYSKPVGQTARFEEWKPLSAAEAPETPPPSPAN